ncbi:hypothetical protein BKA62DRAFT_682840 [Auriculariales sp. MPI-PUGE-AT-0066]|nr:hypothetical protein BKA62DRAFT_682840 [Auriculariales sp. MPI-PUGE-AT-0066]
MATRVPEELLKEIFRLVLHVPDQLFFDTSTSSPFMHVEVSTSALLLVCKRWLRIATPTFYDTLILRSSAQVFSLYNAISANPRFAEQVRRLRLEGKPQDILCGVVKRMTTLEDVCLALNFEYCTKITTSLLKLLRIINPRAIALSRPRQTTLKQTLSTMQVLSEQARIWSKLRTIILPRLYSGSHGSLGTLETELFAIALDSPAVQCVVLPVEDDSAAQSVLRSRALTGLLDQRPLTIMLLFPGVKFLPRTVFDGLKPAHRSLVCFRDNGMPTGTERYVSDLYKNQHEISTLWSDQLNTAPSNVQSTIWRAVIREAVTLREGAQAKSFINTWFDSIGVDGYTAASLLKTCHNFAQHHVVAHSDSAAQGCLDIIGSRPSLASNIRTLVIKNNSPITARLLSTASHLYSVQVGVFQEDFKILREHFSAACSSKTSIKHFVMDSWYLVHDIPPSGSVVGLDDDFLDVDYMSFAGWNSLVSLRWGILTIPFTSPAAENMLAQLQELSTSSACDGFMRWIVACQLPRLSRLSLTGLQSSQSVPAKNAQRAKALDSFLTKHGSKLTDLTINERCVRKAQLLRCSNIATLRLGRDANSSEVSNLQLLAVKELFINWYCVPYSLPKSWERLLEGLYAGAFPGLEQVTSLSSDFWPTSAPAEGAVLWQANADERLRARGVILKDKDGRIWRPRLELSSVLRRSGRVTGRRK